jgi:hypothetical protein
VWCHGVLSRQPLLPGEENASRYLPELQASASGRARDRAAATPVSLWSRGSTRREGRGVDQPQLNWIANYIWGIADDVLRDLYVRGKYRDVILPMTVLRRLDSLLEPTKPAVHDILRCST